MNLGGLIQYCVAQDVRIEFRTVTVEPGKIEMLAHQGDHHFRRRFRNEDFTRETETCFLHFLNEAREELIRLNAAASRTADAP